MRSCQLRSRRVGTTNSKAAKDQVGTSPAYWKRERSLRYFREWSPLNISSSLQPRMKPGNSEAGIGFE